MANLDNLKPIQTTEEAKKLGSSGGKKSAIARRRKKSMKAAAQLLLSLPVQEKNKSKLEQLNIDPDEADNQMLILAALLGKAITGDVKAAKFIQDTAGEGPTAEKDKMALKVEKERIKFLKAQTKRLSIEDDEQEVEDDGFMDALNSSAKDDWNETEESNI